jgi:hypothetical protein
MSGSVTGPGNVDAAEADDRFGAGLVALAPCDLALARGARLDRVDPEPPVPTPVVGLAQAETSTAMQRATPTEAPAIHRNMQRLPAI